MKVAVAICCFVVLAVIFTLAFQSNQFSMQNPSGALTSCPAPTVNSNILCSVTDGYYQSISGAPYAKLGGSGALNFTQLLGQLSPAQMPTSQTCTLSAVIGASDTATISNCK